MAISVNIQNIKRARARRVSNFFSTVDLHCEPDGVGYPALSEVTLFLEGPGHEDAAARIAALINEQVIRRDNPKLDENEVEAEAASRVEPDWRDEYTSAEAEHEARKVDAALDAERDHAESKRDEDEVPF